jgi:hypothetical protein
MYQKDTKYDRKESEYQKAEKRKQIKLFKGLGGGIYRIEDLNKNLVKNIFLEHFLSNPVLNLFDMIRNNVLEYFIQEKIKLWKVYKEDKINKKKFYEVTPENMPTRNLLSSQISCLNHLFPIRQDKENVLKIAKIVCPDFDDILPIYTDEHFPEYIQFESVSEIDHLNEVEPPKVKPPRGEFSTSIDALIYAKHKNGKKYLIPIEWKYTEEYEYSSPPTDKSIGKSGETRLKRYCKLIENSSFLESLPTYKNSIYFFEPFYQLMRQTLWVEQMINNKNEEIIKADDYIHIHVIPNENKELLKINYHVTGKNMEDSWRENLKDPKKYQIITPMDLLKNIDKDKYKNLIEYIKTRYWNNI